ncbi:MAG: GNAT family N-acetyltransferase [Candidatus Binatia bacterium]
MPHRYPQEVALGDGRRVLLRPFTANDTQALWDFFHRLPEPTRRFAWERLDDRAVVESWGRNIDYGKVFPLLAFDGGTIVADASLHRRDGGPLRLVGRIKWMVDPEWRDAGLSGALVNQFISIARGEGLRHLSTILISDLEADAIRTLADAGFRPTVLPGYGADPDGGVHDMTFLVLKL